jgi:hypothetical protein
MKFSVAQVINIIFHNWFLIDPIFEAYHRSLSSVKEKWRKERCEKKEEKKRKEVRGDPHIKGCGS